MTTGPAKATIDERIVALSLKNPEFGPQRIAGMLQKEGIQASQSSVYKVLRGRNLHRKHLRLSLLKEQEGFCNMTPAESPNTLAIDILQTASAPLFEIAHVQPRAICNSPRPLVASAGRNTPLRSQPNMRARASRWFDWDTDASKWLFRGVNTCLAGVAIFIAYQIWDMLREAPAATMPDPATFAAVADRAGAPPSRTRLTDYQVVWSRNLFDSHPVPVAAPVPDIEKIRLAGKELGLTLIGTAIASDAHQSYAILESTKTHSQDIYRENDSTGGVRVKRILRNNVIIAAADGGELRLSVDQQDPGGSRPSNLAARAQGADGWTPARAVASNELPGRNAGEVGRSTLNPEALARLKEVHDPDAAPAEGVLSEGLYVASLLSQTLMDKYGLYSGDLVKGVNGEEVTDPADAADLSKRISAGGPVSITIERRGRMQTLTLQQ